MKRFFVLFMALTLSAFALIGCGSDQNTEAIAELQATVDDLQSQVEECNALKTELDSANDTIAELQSEMDALKTEKEEMFSKLEMLYKIEPVEQIMYAVSDGNIYDDLYAEALGEEPTGTIPEGQEVKVTGKSAVTDWYEIEIDGKKQYVSASLVSQTKPSTNTGSTGNTGNTGNGNTGNTGNTQQPSGGNQPSGGGQQPPADDGFDPGFFGGATEAGGITSGNYDNFEIE